MAVQINNPDFSVPEAQPFQFEGGDHAVLLIHGFTGSAGHMRLVGEGLRDAGFTVRGINLPGHAKDLAAMKATGANDWLEAARSAYRELRQRHGKVSVMGLSMGGVISLILAEQEQPDAVIPVSAPMAVQNKMMPLAKILSPLMPVISWGDGDPNDNLLIDKYNLGYGGFPTRCAADLAALIKKARKNLSRVKCPILVVQSHADGTIDARSADVILGNVSSGAKRMLWLEEVPHVCTITRETPHIVDEAVRFLHEREA
ncbi:MAG: alpha/beta fold hydrolase [Clostridia bacterium]|nr:alpha/beta fold hydrolase [Clostridia bacterium]